MNGGKRPHIIIFNPDEMRGDALHHLGNPAAITPNLDAFTKEAVSFSNAFCQNPVCVPSRCSFCTGLYPHTLGHRTMSHLLHPGEPSVFSELKDAGYYVWMNDRNDLTAGQIEGWTESHASVIYYGGQKANPPKPEKPGLRGEKGGKYYYSHFEGKLLPDDSGRYYSDDDEVVDAAIEQIRNRPADQPMCMFLGLMYPHAPYEVEEPYYSAVDRSLIPERIRSADCSGKAKILDEIRSYTGMEAFTEEDWRELRAVYLGMCMKIDAQFGRLVAALKEEGIYDDCAIFFFSDHGDFTGDYDLPEKAQNTFENCLSKVPLLVKAPAGTAMDPGICTAPVELVDFYATAMEMAGVQPGHTHFGKSLVPVLQDRSARIRDFACCEGGRNPGETHCDEYHASPKGMPEESPYWPKAMAQTSDEAHAKGIMLFDGRYKYVSREPGRDELYDLEEDPQERHNRIDDPALAGIAAEKQRQMLKWLQRTSDIVPFALDARFTGEMMWNRVRRLVPADREEEVRQRIRDGEGLAGLVLYCRSLSREEPRDTKRG